MKMSIRIDLEEVVGGQIVSRVAIGVKPSDKTEMPNWALLDHMLRKMDDCMIEAKAQLVKQTTLQDLQPQIEAPL